jgi:hypothetical protein
LQLSPALQVVVVKLPRQMTTQFSKYEQSFTDCAGAYSHKKCDEVAKCINPLSSVYTRELPSEIYSTGSA